MLRGRLINAHSLPFCSKSNRNLKVTEKNPSGEDPLPASKHTKSSRLVHSGLVYLWLTLIILIVDSTSKSLIQFYLQPYTSLNLFPFFNLTLTYNTGAAFSFLNTGTLWPNILFGIIAITVSIFLLAWLYRLPSKAGMMNTALAFILGGALGNCWDRIRYHHVIDFLDFYVANWHWPVFNIADAAVFIGACLLMWDRIRKKRR